MIWIALVIAGFVGLGLRSLLQGGNDVPAASPTLLRSARGLKDKQVNDDMREGGSNSLKY